MNDKLISADSCMSVKKAQELILDFVKTYFSEDKVAIVIDLINKCPVYFGDEQINNLNVNEDIYDKKNIGAFASLDSIFIPSDYATYSESDEWGMDYKLNAIIHEYAHMLRKVNSENGAMFEEGFATIFAEACIINYKIKKQNRAQIIQPAVYTLTGWKYKKAESQVRSLLYILNQKGLDIQMIGEYILGDEKIFEQKCSEIFGEAFKTYFKLASSNEDQYYNDYDNVELNSENYLIKMLSNYIKDNKINLNNYWNENYLFLYGRSSETFSKSVTSIDIANISPDNLDAYHLFESYTKYINQDNESIVNNRIERIKKFILERYSLTDFNNLYEVITDLSTEYIRRKESSKKEDKIFIEEIKKMIPNVEEFVSNYIKLRHFIISPTMFDDIDKKNLSYSNINQFIVEKIKYFKKQEQTEELMKVKMKFKQCHTKQHLFEIIKFIEINFDKTQVSDIIPNYGDFIKYVNDIQYQIPDNFDFGLDCSYEIIYQKVFEIYIAKKEIEIKKAKMTKQALEIEIAKFSKKYVVITSEEKFNEVSSMDEKLQHQLQYEQAKMQKNEDIKKQYLNERGSLLEQLDNLKRRNFLIRLFNRKKSANTKSRIAELSSMIDLYDNDISKIRNVIELIRTDIFSNEQKLKDACGIGLNEYKIELSDIKEKKLTQEQLLQHLHAIKKEIQNLEIRALEHDLKGLYLKNEMGDVLKETIVKDETNSVKQ